MHWLDDWTVSLHCGSVSSCIFLESPTLKKSEYTDDAITVGWTCDEAESDADLSPMMTEMDQEEVNNRRKTYLIKFRMPKHDCKSNVTCNQNLSVWQRFEFSSWFSGGLNLIFLALSFWSAQNNWLSILHAASDGCLARLRSDAASDIRLVRHWSDATSNYGLAWHWSWWSQQLSSDKWDLFDERNPQMMKLLWWGC